MNNGNIDWPKDETELNDFWYYLSGADGKDGVTPNIGDNGNWYINGEDTGKPARGPQGEQGADGKPGQDGKPGENGDDGAPGAAGQSAYDLWVQEVKAGDFGC